MLTVYVTIGSIVLLLAISALHHGLQWRLVAMARHLTIAIGRRAERAGQEPRL
jgi:hypothetical protein